jgi:1-acyl-sn-glycerol-3-phosphate acyltransferase
VVDAVVSFGEPVAVGAAHDRKDVTRRLEIAVRTLTASALRGRALTAA